MGTSTCNWSDPIPEGAPDWAACLPPLWEKLHAILEPYRPDALFERAYQTAIARFDRVPEPQTMAEGNTRWRGLVVDLWIAVHQQQARDALAARARKGGGHGRE